MRSGVRGSGFGAKMPNTKRRTAPHPAPPTLNIPASSTWHSSTRAWHLSMGTKKVQPRRTDPARLRCRSLPQMDIDIPLTLKQKRPPKLGGRSTDGVRHLRCQTPAGSPATLSGSSASGGRPRRGPVALRPTLSDSLPFSADKVVKSCGGTLQPYLTALPGVKALGEKS